MKLTRIAILVLLAAAGCRFAEAQKDVAARRLTEMLLSRLVSLQGAPVTTTRPAQPVETATVEPAPVTAPKATPPQPLIATPMVHSFAASHTVAPACPVEAAKRAAHAAAVRSQVTSARHPETVWFRIALPVSPSCERAKLSGS